MDSPGVGRVRPKFSSLPLVFERQILTLGAKVTLVLSFNPSYIRNPSRLNYAEIFNTDIPSWFDASWSHNDQMF